MVVFSDAAAVLKNVGVVEHIETPTTNMHINVKPLIMNIVFVIEKITSSSKVPSILERNASKPDIRFDIEEHI